MTIQTSVLTPEAAGARLAQMFLTRAMLTDALLNGYNHAARCTALHPTSLAGTLVWAEGLAELRAQTRPSGYTICRDGNFERAVSPGGRFAIAIVPGNNGTGRADVVPRTKRPRGPETQNAVKHNEGTFDALLEAQAAGRPVELVRPRSVLPAQQTWLLMHFPDAADHVVRSELSLPSAMSGSTIMAWAERILLPNIHLDPTVEIYDAPDEGTDDIVVPIRRRAD